ncbi:hydroxyisourate hydrolase [Halothiobacillus diazotrophicus]|uniref:5-hydroxyisourate hydrolase n=1 Tax=Halothiobacillus diazotrophicus TaxID=1860122 RepID=A0A191ZE18_9GAMM|nr:hydroxyisourate hydrolase [Halothiobacillus diazotrophicus]ANJ66110.1 hydroxyisourate hydrolase [Halothiobacillus diazotrophicus]
MSTHLPITTHVLDLGSGKPAAGVAIALEHEQDTWRALAQGITDPDGRLKFRLDLPVASGTYRLTFATADYFTTRGKTCFYPQVRIEFSVDAAADHYHVPLLLNQWGYSTYRGS